MGLSKEIVLTVKDYEIKLNRDIKFYENDTIDLCFSILEYGIEVKDGVAVNKLMPINALKSYMLIETPQGVDYAESTKVENNRVVFNLGNKYSQFIGIGRMQIVIKDNDGCRITLPEFPFEIRESINSNWDKDITVFSTENNEIIIDEFGRKIELKKISEMEEANTLPINSYSMILDNNENKKIKTNLITQKIENDLQLVNEQLDNIAYNKVFNNIFLHRGAIEVCPENTLASIYEAKKLGVPFCELDVRCTSDGVLILHHDSTIDRMTNGVGSISSLTLEQLKIYNIDSGNRIELYPNEKIPSLEDALILSKQLNVKLMLHMYDLGGTTSAEGIKKLYDLLLKTSMVDNVILSGVNTYWYFYEMRKLNKSIPFSYVMPSYDESHFSKVKELMPCYYGVIGRPAKEVVDKCHLNGIKVVCDTVTVYNHYLMCVENKVDIMLSDIIVGGDM